MATAAWGTEKPPLGPMSPAWGISGFSSSGAGPRVDPSEPSCLDPHPPGSHRHGGFSVVRQEGKKREGDARELNVCMRVCVCLCMKECVCTCFYVESSMCACVHTSVFCACVD